MALHFCRLSLGVLYAFWRNRYRPATFPGGGGSEARGEGRERGNLPVITAKPPVAQRAGGIVFQVLLFVFVSPPLLFCFRPFCLVFHYRKYALERHPCNARQLKWTGTASYGTVPVVTASTAPIHENYMRYSRNKLKDKLDKQIKKY